MNYNNQIYFIGVTGKCGAGKTTFSHYLQEELPLSTLIHADDIMFDAVLSEKKLLIQLYGNDIISDGKLNKNLYMSDENKRFVIGKLISQKIKTALKDKISELVSLNKNTVIILDWFRLPECTDIWQNCQTKILIKSIDENLRWFYLNQRRRITLQDFALRDKMINHDAFLYDEIILNGYDNSLSDNAKIMAKKIMKNECEK